MATASERPVWESWRGRIANEIAQAHREEIHRRCAHVANEITPRVVGFVESEYFLATTGMCHRRWNGRELKMTQDAPEHRLLGDSGHDLECTTAAQRTCGYSQVKPPSQQPRPLPIWHPLQAAQAPRHLWLCTDGPQAASAAL
jgi:hypothetical protein